MNTMIFFFEYLSESGFSRHVLNVVNVLKDEQDKRKSVQIRNICVICVQNQITKSTNHQITKKSVPLQR